MVRLFGRKSAQPTSTSITATLLNDGGGRRVAVVGESQYQEIIKEVVKDLLRDGEIYETNAVLIPEPDNKHDRNAVAVFLHGGNMIGYLSRDDAIAYQPVVQEMKRRKTFGACRAIIAGGTKEKPSYGVFLDLARPSEAIPEDE